MDRDGISAALGGDPTTWADWADGIAKSCVIWVAEDPTRAMLWLGGIMTPLMIAGLWAARVVLKEDEKARKRAAARARKMRAANGGQTGDVMYKTD